MPRYYRRTYRYRSRPRKYVRRYIRRRFKRFVNGSSKSRIRVKVPFSGAVTFTQQANATYSDVLYLSPVQYCTDAAAADNTALAYPFSAISNPLFTNYANLYDEVKCDGMKLQIAITDAVPNTNWNCVTIHTCWDRKTTRYDYSDAPDTDNIVNSATYIPATALNNSVAKIVRSCYPSDLLEKITFVDSSVGTAAAIQVQGVANKHMAAITGTGVVSTQTVVPAFTPTLSMCVGTGTAPAALRTLHVRIEGMAYYTFRNPKYGGSAQNKMSELADAIRTEDAAAAANAARLRNAIDRRDAILNDVHRGTSSGAVTELRGLNTTLVQDALNRSRRRQEARRVMQEVRNIQHRADMMEDPPNPVLESEVVGPVAGIVQGVLEQE